MAQSNFEERIDTYEIESTNVMTGDRDRIRYLYYQLKMSIPSCGYRSIPENRRVFSAAILTWINSNTGKNGRKKYLRNL